MDFELDPNLDRVGPGCIGSNGSMPVPVLQSEHRETSKTTGVKSMKAHSTK